MNKIPENWITYKISDLCDFQNGYAFNSSDYVEEGMPIIRMSNISIDGNLNLTSENTKYYPREKVEILKKYVLNKNDVVMAMTDMTKDMGIIGKTAIIDEDNKYLLNQRVGRLIIKNPKILDYKYLHRYTNSPRFLDYAKQQCSGGVQLNLSTKAILNHKIILPSTIEEQQEIVQVLDTMNDIIRLRKECISHAQDLIPALFQEMFGNPLTNDKNLPIVRIDTVTKVVSGGTPSTQNSEYWDGDIIWLTPKDLSGYNSMYISKGERNITDLGYKKSSAQMMPKGSVLFTSRAPIGYVAIADTDLCTNQGFKSFIPTEAIKSEYLYQLLKMSKEKIINMSSGATFKEISGGRIKELKIPLPPIELQEQFAQKVIKIEAYIKEQQEELKKAKQMFQSLLHHAFTGELTRRAYGKI